MIVVTSQGIKRDISDEAAKKSGLLNQFLNDSRTHDVTLHGRFLEAEGILDRVIAYLERNELPTEPEQHERIFNMILAADYMQIPALLDIYTSKIRDVLATSSNAEEVRKKVGAPDDLTTKELASTAKEKVWEEFDVVDYPSMHDMSVSMMVDGGSQFRTATADGQHSPPLREDLEDIVKFVQPRRPMAPIPDEHAPSCSKCQAPFNTINRRHHCRRCGMVFRVVPILYFLTRSPRFHFHFQTLHKL